MLIGVPKEIKTHEYRVGLTPSSVRELVAHDHDVIVSQRNRIVLLKPDTLLSIASES